MHFFLAAITLIGAWQGTLDAPGIGKLPRIMVITKDTRGYNVAIHSITETDVPIATRNVSISGSSVVMKFDMNTDPWMNYHRLYRAHVSPDGKTITGSWQGTYTSGAPLAMVYHRADHVTIPPRKEKLDSFVTVDTGVKDEVIDWGGTGRPVLLLAGQGVTARGFGGIIPDLVRKYHVYSMTRRGFGNSSKPAFTHANYNATRLGKDVLAVIDALRLQKPILMGHSLAGEELSYIGKNAPDKVAGLIYLDSGYWYAFDFGIPQPVEPGPPPGAPRDPLGDALDDNPTSFKPPFGAPILAFYAHPMRLSSGDPKDVMARFEEFTSKQIVAMREQIPNAQIVVIPNADHFIFNSNKNEVLSDINAFIAKLPMP